MATIRPFRGIRYSPTEVTDLSQVVSQPFDRVRYGLQEQYYELSPYNVVRIAKGKENATDDPGRPGGQNVYTRARAYYDLWRAEQVLVQEAEPALYAYQQSFEVDGTTRTRKGVIAALELAPFSEGVVLPHERTHSGPTLMKGCGDVAANEVVFTPSFLVSSCAVPVSTPVTLSFPVRSNTRDTRIRRGEMSSRGSFRESSPR